MGRARKSPAGSRRKKVCVKIIERKHAGKIVEPYRIMEELIEQYHTHLREAKIAIGARVGWGPDPDGRIRLGTMKKASDLDHQMHQYDFVMLLNSAAWTELNEKQRVALIDHELCHAAVCIDANGEPKKDERGRTVWRVRKHDLEEFREIVARHGTYKEDIQEFVRAANARAKEPLLTNVPSATIPITQSQGA